MCSANLEIKMGSFGNFIFSKRAVSCELRELTRIGMGIAEYVRLRGYSFLNFNPDLPGLGRISGKWRVAGNDSQGSGVAWWPERFRGKVLLAR